MSHVVALVHLTSNDALGAFLANKRSPATRSAYAADLKSFARYLGVEAAASEHTILAANVGQVIGWRDSMISSGAAPATVARRLSSLRTFYRFAKSIGAVSVNVAELVEGPRVDSARQRAPHLEARQARKLLSTPDTKTVRGLRDRAILGLLASSGLRRAEVAGVRLADVTSATAGISVMVDGKGGRVRTVDVDRATADAIVAYLAAQGRMLGSEHGPLFRPLRNPRGQGNLDKHLTLRAINAIVAGYAISGDIAAEGGAVAPHALRRTFATVAIDRGASLETLRRTMGHADLRTTARYDRRRQSTLTVTY
ncbi:MAG: tyrosine-type recombinase/integrase [Deltaproteobacteria bacterium]|nr:tyrosine-type recombinase/integrase [Deltaproteobacteria bacterium]